MSFHQFNPFTGRLKPATQSQAFYPLAPSKLQTADPIMIYDTIKTQPAKVLSTTTRSQSTLSPKMATLYKKYQADLNKPSYLLAGTRDKILYRGAIALTVMSLMANVYYIIKMEKKF